jgi:hypothetical protein
MVLGKFEELIPVYTFVDKVSDTFRVRLRSPTV